MTTKQKNINLPLIQIDAFADEVFSGNPAAVIPLQEWLPEIKMQQIAQEINLSETAFFVPNVESFDLRWFTPLHEVRLCGHATLATAHALYHHLGYDRDHIIFNTKSGPLYVYKIKDGYQMDFPADPPEEIAIPNDLEKHLACKILSMHRGNDDYLAIIEDQDTLTKLTPDFSAIAKMEMRGLVVSTRGTNSDIASRCFYPKYGINEDPVTGSAHTMLTPYWSNILTKKHIYALQLSKRKGFIACQWKYDRVLLSGKAITTITGEFHL